MHLRLNISIEFHRLRRDDLGRMHCTPRYSTVSIIEYSCNQDICFQLCWITCNSRTALLCLCKFHFVANVLYSNSWIFLGKFSFAFSGAFLWQLAACSFWGNGDGTNEEVPFPGLQTRVAMYARGGDEGSGFKSARIHFIRDAWRVAVWVWGEIGWFRQGHKTS